MLIVKLSMDRMDGWMDEWIFMCTECIKIESRTYTHKYILFIPR